VSRLCPPSAVLNNWKTFQKLGILPSSDEWKETPALLGPLEGANLNHRTEFFLRDPTENVSPSSHLKMERDPVI
jgi:hypothetical protein